MFEFKTKKPEESSSNWKPWHKDWDAITSNHPKDDAIKDDGKYRYNRKGFIEDDESNDDSILIVDPRWDDYCLQELKLNHPFPLYPEARRVLFPIRFLSSFTMGDGEWQEVTHKKRRSVFDRLGNTTNVYVSNFPSHLMVRKLSNICGKKGSIIDVYIAKHKNKLGQMFGFCHYSGIEKIENLIDSLNTVWIGKLRLHANIARFDRNKGFSPNQTYTKKFESDVKHVPADSTSVNQGGVEVKYLGGLWVMFVFIDKKVRESFLNHEGSEDKSSKAASDNDDEESVGEFFNNDSNETHFNKDEEITRAKDIVHQPIISDPFELESFIAKNGNYQNQGSLTPKFPPGFTQSDGGDINRDLSRVSKHVEREGKDETSIHYESKSMQPDDEVTKKYVGVSMLQQVEDTIKVGIALGFNMEGCQDMLAKMIADMGDKDVWGNSQFDFASSSARGRSGGILCIWNKLLFHKEKVISVDSHVAVQGTWLQNGLKIMFVMVYAPQDLARKITLWSSLSPLILNWDGNAIIMGDFNEIREDGDRFGTDFNEKQSEIFNSFINNMNLRFHDAFPSITSSILEKGKLDNRPILLKESVKDFDSGETIGMISFKKKLQNLKKVIHAWSTSKKISDNQIKKEHKSRLSLIDAKVDQGVGTRDDLDCRISSMKILSDIDRKEASDIAQKAKKKRRECAIKGILHNGIWIDDPGEVKSEFYNHFRKRFSCIDGIRSTVGDILFNQISTEQCEYLERDVSNEEIKKAVWDYGGDQARVRMASHLSCNSSFFALVPKVGDAKFVSDFRPISLIGCQYKIIGKLLANRLSSVIRNCVSFVQSAFIKGRNILDSPLVLNECMAWYRKRKKALMVFKFDFEKAFDSLRWNYLDAIMEKLGFGNKWRMWIVGCLKNSRASILVNGSPTSEFELFKGLREWSHSNAYNLICLLRCFYMVSGLKINVHKSKLSGVNVPDEDVSNMALVLGCGVTKLPMMYLGVPVVGGRLSLIKAVLGNLPTYYMSLYWMPKSVQNHLESMRNKFFLGGDIDKKSSPGSNGKLVYLVKLWVVLALEVNVIKEIHGIDGGIGSNKAGNSTHSPCFWNERWYGDRTFKEMFLRVYALDVNKSCTISQRIRIKVWPSIFRRPPRGGAKSIQLDDLLDIICHVSLSDSVDGWKWELDISGFLVSSTRSYIDDHTLLGSFTSTRWLRCIPIKVNTFIWKLRLDKLPTLVNLDKIGIDVSSLLCPVCTAHVENVDHLFFSCGMAEDLWGLLARWCALDIPEVPNIVEWYSWLDSVHVSKQARSILEGIASTMLWSIWNFHNAWIFSMIKPKKSNIWDSIVHQSFLWISSRNPKCRFRWLD
ncbi:RNA-directed DNA polymerase, eukaryota, reverse transcriptase zinc-binding domain protein [Tanacetum coccineum]|uniref:RNA-directed DNA polymerase, eukaryota, reverse transcriptase zinc-binding domain protein n=1 Tax=Tanacetum coccineum TaxID=301880 RepID=A0ABQ5FAH0_9ASTR